ncbi:MAG TPA: hypothetical protein VHZ07_09340 [Bryobacteraceae bacterium]|jgi:hypothetical protein|nr:hypothetical protein [Bryobacteraceae bacterium]
MSPDTRGYDPRLDRIERALERLIADHERFRQDHNQLMTALLLHNESDKRFLKIAHENGRQIGEQGKQIEKQSLQIEAQGIQSRDRSDGIDLRIERLISAFGEFIRRTPF